MSRMMILLGLLLIAAPTHGQTLPKPMISGLKNPESICVGDGRLFITEIGEFNKDGDGRVLVVDKNGAAVAFATGLDDPKGIVYFQKKLFVADNKRVMMIDEDGTLHRHGVMRLATAADEILPLRDPRVQQNEAYLIVIVLARVLVRLGTLSDIDTSTIEGLYASDLAYLQQLYERLNAPEQLDDEPAPIGPGGQAMHRMSALGGV